MGRILGGLLILISVLVLTEVTKGQTTTVAYNPSNLIRLHVVANSDQEEDQRLKREIRDVILERLAPELGETKTINEVRNIIRDHLGTMEILAQNHLMEAGNFDRVKAEYGKYSFPIKSYGDLTLPAGQYEAVRVVIGEGKGANWWCVLFPPLCFVDISNSLAAETEVKEVFQTDHERINSNSAHNIQVEFKFMEFFNERSQQLKKLVNLEEQHGF